MDDQSLDIEALVQRLEQYNAAYRNGRPMVSDTEYDRFVEQLREISPGHPFLRTVEPEEFSGKKKIQHPDPMLSTEKAYTEEDLRRFVLRVEKAAGLAGADAVRFRITAKLDGLAGRDDGHLLVTRGDGRWGYDITNAYEKGVVPVGGRGGGLGEIVIVKSYFDAHLSSVFEHPRNLVVGIISSDQVNEQARRALEDQAVHFVAYSTMAGQVCSAEELVSNTAGISEAVLDGVDYPVDGLVVEVTDVAVRRAMGRTAHHYRWQIAIKTRGETASTTVVHVTWQIGRTGNVTPVMTVVPVPLSGATIGRVTAHNAGMIERHRIGPGAEIEIIRSGEVIPKLERVLSPAAETSLPSSCPSCGTGLIRQNDFLRCPNTEGCRDQAIQRIRYWFHTLGNADWFGQKTVEKLVDAGFSTLERIYDMNAADYEGLGFGPVQSANLEAATRLSRTQIIEDWRFLAAFGIPDLGLGDSRNLLRVFPLEILPHVSPEQIARIRGFGERTGNQIAEGLLSRRKMISHMLVRNFLLERTRPRMADFILALGLMAGIDRIEGLSQKEKKTKTEALAGILAGRLSLEALAAGDEAAVLMACGGDRAVCDLVMTEANTLADSLAVVAGLPLEWIRPAEIPNTGRASAISGKRIVFTGKMQRGSRQEMMRLAEGMGAVVQTAVSGNTDLLVCGEKVGDKKMEKARSAGVRILSESEYLQMIEKDGGI